MLAAAAAGCQRKEEPLPPEIRPVRTVTVEELPGGETIQLTGRIEAEEEVALAFRAGGRMLERTVSVGDRVAAGQRIGRDRCVGVPRVRHVVDVVDRRRQVQRAWGAQGFAPPAR